MRRNHELQVVAIFSLFLGILPASNASDIDELLLAFKNCNLDKAVFVPDDQLAEAHRHGISTPPSIQSLVKIKELDGVARFDVSGAHSKVKVTFLDIPVYAPRDDNQVWRLYFDEPYLAMRRRLGNILSISFPKQPMETEQYKRGRRPALLIDKITGSSFIKCSKVELGE